MGFIKMNKSLKVFQKLLKFLQTKNYGRKNNSRPFNYSKIGLGIEIFVYEF